MELDDLKNTWEDINSQVKKEENLTPAMIEQITKTNYYSNLKKITYPEIIGVIVCLGGAAFIALNFSKLDTSFLQGIGILSILVLIALSVISLISLRLLTMQKNVNSTYVAILKEFALQKLRFQKFQRINITLSYLLLVTTIILLSKFIGGKDITGNKYFWTFSFTVGYLFLLFYSKLVMKSYNTTLRQAEDLLKELAS